MSIDNILENLSDEGISAVMEYINAYKEAETLEDKMDAIYHITLLHHINAIVNMDKRGKNNE